MHGLNEACAKLKELLRSCNFKLVVERNAANI